MTNPIYVNCFCISDNPQSGNPAAVIINFLGDDLAKQDLAAELNLPVTVFVDQKDHTYHVRFFYPECEMPLCIHGMLSAASVIMQRESCYELTISTNVNIFHIEKSDNNIFYLHLSRGKIEAIHHQDDLINKMLGIRLSDIDSRFPFCISSVGSPKFLIPLKSYDLLANLKPNFSFIKNWSIENNINGIYVYTTNQNDPTNIHARGFNPKGGKNEDPATGVAAAALFQAMNTDFLKIYQGECIGNPSQIYVKQKTFGSDILVGGIVERGGGSIYNPSPRPTSDTSNKRSPPFPYQP